MEYPEGDLRKLIDKTAEFVATRGVVVEQKLYEKSASKFSFLRPDDEFRAYYEHKLSEFSEQFKEVEEEPEEAVEENPFIVEQPIIAKIDMDVVKLTAQFVAKNGKIFWKGLSEKEAKNPQFEFLKPNHALFAYFTGLVEAYSRCLLPKLEDIVRLQKLVKERESILQRALDQFQKERVSQRNQRPKEEVEEEERQQMMMIDWHDFVVVETIDFYDEEVLPPPNDKSYVHTLDTGKYTIEDKKPLKIDSTYTQKCPKCGEMIPVDDFPNHIRLELLHPQYKEERAKARISESQTVYAPGSEIYKNLLNLAKHRPDLVDENAEAPIEQTFSLGGKQDDFIPSKVINPTENSDDKPQKSNSLVNQVIQDFKKNIPRENKPEEPESFIDFKHVPDKVPVLAPTVQVQPERTPYRLYEDTRNQMVPEEQWASSHTGNCTINIRVPEDGGDPKWGFNGQVLQINVVMMQAVSTVKEMLSQILGGMPTQKMKLKTHVHSVLKDTETLAKYNIQNGALIDLTLKERGGRRKN